MDCDHRDITAAVHINKFAKRVHRCARLHGWWDQPRSDLECLALIHAEASEAVEACRNDPDAPCDKDIPLTAFEEELADKRLF